MLETFAGGTARLLVRNSGEVPLELTVEPWAVAHPILPGQTCVVVTHSPAEDGSWSGTLRGDEPLQVDHRPDSITVWANNDCFRLQGIRQGRSWCGRNRGGCPEGLRPRVAKRPPNGTAASATAATTPYTKGMVASATASTRIR